jgi:hypothetical protein
MKSSNHIERLAGNIRFRPDKKTDERILAAAEAALSKRTFPDTKPENMGIIIMRNPIIRIAVAAVVVIACVIGLSLWRTTGSGIALADVLAQIEKVEAYRYKWILKIYGDEAPGKPVNVEIRAAVLESRQHGSKSSTEVLDPNGGESTFTEVYYLPQKKTMIRITPKQKKYEREEIGDAMGERRRKQNDSDPGALVRKIQKCRYESMGRSIVDGVEAEGFRTTDPNYERGTGFKNLQVDVKIWVDVKTRLPVRYEEVTRADFDRNGNRMSQQFVWYDFQWGVPVDPAEFEPVIPDDYTVVTAPKKPAATEENAIKGLKLYADLSGHYPKNPNWTSYYQWSAFEKSDTSAAQRLKEEIKGLTEEKKANRLRDALLPLHGIGIFYAQLVRKAKDPAYYGETVTPKDADKVLLRSKVSDNEYRVIFGDLHIETVTSEKLAELEKALPK